MVLPFHDFEYTQPQITDVDDYKIHKYLSGDCLALNISTPVRRSLRMVLAAHYCQEMNGGITSLSIDSAGLDACDVQELCRDSFQLRRLQALSLRNNPFGARGCPPPPFLPVPLLSVSGSFFLCVHLSRKEYSNRVW